VNRQKWQAIGILASVFALGAVSGVGVLTAWHGEFRREVAQFGLSPRGARPMMAMMRRLKLSEQQQQAIGAILAKHAPARRAIMQEMTGKCGQELEREKSAQDSEIRAVLNPEQRTQFDELSKRQHERVFGEHHEHSQ
jgi:Spy/CpxP family protein refolding chaperone